MNEENIYTERPPLFSPQAEAVGCCCVYDKKILILQRSLHKIEGGFWCSPGGKIEPGETRIEALLREVREETGILLNADRIQFVQTVYTRRTAGDSIYHHYFSQLDHLPTVVLNSEHCAFQWLPYSELFTLALMRGAPTVLRSCEKLLLF